MKVQAYLKEVYNNGTAPELNTQVYTSVTAKGVNTYDYVISLFIL